MAVVSDSFFFSSFGWGSYYIGPDIRRRSSRSIAGKGACTPSWGSIGLVLDQGENYISFIFTCMFWRQISPEEHPRLRVRVRGAPARRKKVVLDQGIHTQSAPLSFFISDSITSTFTGYFTRKPNAY